MYEFMEALYQVNPGKREEIVSEDDRERNHSLKPISVGRVDLQFHAGLSAYSMPRMKVELDSYEEFELLVFVDTGKEFVRTDIEEIEELSDFERLDELLKRRDDVGVYAYVDNDLIDDLYVYATHVGIKG